MVASDHVKSQLGEVEPSISGGLPLHPCEVETDDGLKYPRVLLVDARAYAEMWGYWPLALESGRWMPIERIRQVRSSPHRLPARFATFLYESGESGMDYYAFAVDFSDMSLSFVTRTYVDFPCWPPGAFPREIVAVRPHVRNLDHHLRPPSVYETGADFLTAPYL